MDAVNPYESPHAPCDTTTIGAWRSSLLWLLPTGMLASCAVGAFTNVVNGTVSPEYFSIVMGWPGDDRLWARSVAQGALEGAAYGLFFSLIYAGTVAFASRGKCTYRQAVRYVPLACGGVVLAWTIGGLAGLAWAAFASDSYRAVFPILPHMGAERFGWVGGSIWGAVYGGLLVVVVVSAVFVVCWRRNLALWAPIARSHAA